MWTEKDDEEVGYGVLKVFTHKEAMAELHKVHPPKKPEDIWPHWSEGVPTKLRRRAWSERFVRGKVSHRDAESSESLEIQWSRPRPLSVLENSKSQLPGLYSNEWSGVYRIFAMNAAIDRCCGQDPTETLYLGRAGSGKLSWSILRSRVRQMAKRDHHAVRNWGYSKALREKFPWETLAVEWAFTNPERPNYMGDPFPEAKMAEGWLLSCYRDSFGELPPWNDKA